MKKKPIKTKLLGTLYGRHIYFEQITGTDNQVIVRAFEQILETAERIKRLPWWKRLFNLF